MLLLKLEFEKENAHSLKASEFVLYIYLIDVAHIDNKSFSDAHEYP